MASSRRCCCTSPGAPRASTRLATRCLDTTGPRSLDRAPIGWRRGRWSRRGARSAACRPVRAPGRDRGGARRGPEPAETDQARIVTPTTPCCVAPSFVAALNRAVAVAMRDLAPGGGRRRGRREGSGGLDCYLRVIAARADLFRRLGRDDDARASYALALLLTRQPAERRKPRGAAARAARRAAAVGRRRPPLRQAGQRALPPRAGVPLAATRSTVSPDASAGPPDAQGAARMTPHHRPRPSSSVAAFGLRASARAASPASPLLPEPCRRTSARPRSPARRAALRRRAPMLAAGAGASGAVARRHRFEPRPDANERPVDHPSRTRIARRVSSRHARAPSSGSRWKARRLHGARADRVAEPRRAPGRRAVPRRTSSPAGDRTRGELPARHHVGGRSRGRASSARSRPPRARLPRLPGLLARRRRLGRAPPPSHDHRRPRPRPRAAPPARARDLASRRGGWLPLRRPPPRAARPLRAGRIASGERSARTRPRRAGRRHFVAARVPGGRAARPRATPTLPLRRGRHRLRGVSVHPRARLALRAVSREPPDANGLSDASRWASPRASASRCGSARGETRPGARPQRRRDVRRQRRDDEPARSVVAHRRIGRELAEERRPHRRARRGPATASSYVGVGRGSYTTTIARSDPAIAVNSPRCHLSRELTAPSNSAARARGRGGRRGRSRWRWSSWTDRDAEAREHSAKPPSCSGKAGVRAVVELVCLDERRLDEHHASRAVDGERPAYETPSRRPPRAPRPRTGVRHHGRGEARDVVHRCGGYALPRRPASPARAMAAPPAGASRKAVRSEQAVASSRAPRDGASAAARRWRPSAVPTRIASTPGAKSARRSRAHVGSRAGRGPSRGSAHASATSPASGARRSATARCRAAAAAPEARARAAATGLSSAPGRPALTEHCTEPNDPLSTAHWSASPSPEYAATRTLRRGHRALERAGRSPWRSVSSRRRLGGRRRSCRCGAAGSAPSTPAVTQARSSRRPRRRRPPSLVGGTTVAVAVEAAEAIPESP